MGKWLSKKHPSKETLKKYFPVWQFQNQAKGRGGFFRTMSIRKFLISFSFSGWLPFAENWSGLLWGYWPNSRFPRIQFTKIWWLVSQSVDNLGFFPVLQKISRNWKPIKYWMINDEWYQAYLKHTLIISWAYVGQIWGICRSWAHLKHMFSISWI